MNKHIYLCGREEVVGFDETTTYNDFLISIGEKFKLRADSFFVKGMEENNFLEVILLEDTFEIERTEKDKALERLNGKNDFRYILTLEQAEDFLNVYGFKEKSYGDHTFTPLLLAVVQNNTEISKLIIEKDFEDANRANNEGSTPLFFAACGGNIEIVKLLLEKDFDDAHRANEKGQTPLYQASLNCRNEVVKLILEKDFPNAHQECNRGITPLYNAVSFENVELTKLP